MALQYQLKEGNYHLYDLSTPQSKATGEHRLRLVGGRLRARQRFELGERLSVGIVEPSLPGAARRQLPRELSQPLLRRLQARRVGAQGLAHRLIRRTGEPLLEVAQAHARRGQHD